MPDQDSKNSFNLNTEDGASQPQTPQPAETSQNPLNTGNGVPGTPPQVPEGNTGEPQVVTPKDEAAGPAESPTPAKQAPAQPNAPQTTPAEQTPTQPNAPATNQPQNPNQVSQADLDKQLEQELEKAVPATEAPEQKSNTTKYIIIGVSVVILLGLAYFGYSFLTGDDNTPEQVESTTPPPTVESPFAETEEESTEKETVEEEPTDEDLNGSPSEEMEELEEVIEELEEDVNENPPGLTLDTETSGHEVSDEEVSDESVDEEISEEPAEETTEETINEEPSDTTEEEPLIRR
ncbi:hypothetical protein GF354_06090 [Candidatus Peregrinibacteria bacterium]|nr:hypothetical protein [Candidatus Peregrinibacteria bacterium]